MFKGQGRLPATKQIEISRCPQISPPLKKQPIYYHAGGSGKCIPFVLSETKRTCPKRDIESTFYKVGCTLIICGEGALFNSIRKALSEQIWILQGGLGERERERERDLKKLGKSSFKKGVCLSFGPEVSKSIPRSI